MTKLGLIAVLALAGCAASESKMNADRSAWGDCIATAVARTDDGRTDPMSLAYGIAPMCASLYQKLSDDMESQAITKTGQAYARDRMSADELRLITSAVLIHRQKRGQ